MFESDLDESRTQPLAEQNSSCSGNHIQHLNDNITPSYLYSYQVKHIDFDWSFKSKGIVENKRPQYNATYFIRFLIPAHVESMEPINRWVDGEERRKMIQPYC